MECIQNEKMREMNNEMHTKWKNARNEQWNVFKMENARNEQWNAFKMKKCEKCTMECIQN